MNPINSQIFTKDFLHTTSQEQKNRNIENIIKDPKYISCIQNMREFLKCRGKNYSFNVPIRKETTIIKNIENDEKSYKETERIGLFSINYKCCPSILNVIYDFQKNKQKIKISHNYIDDSYIKKYKPEEHFCISLYESINNARKDISSVIDMSDSEISITDEISP